MAGVDDIIGRWVKKVEKTGELERSELFGKPFELDPAYERTPDDVRMAHKVLKNAGYVPPEVEAMRRIAELRERLRTADDSAEAQRLRKELAEQQQKLAVRLERRRR